MAWPLSILTDEVSEDFERALDLIRGWGLEWVAVRSLWGKNVVDLTGDEVARVARALQQRGLRVENIASPVFKSPLREGDAAPDSPGFYAATTGPEAQLEVLERALAVAAALGTNLIRVFSFWRRGPGGGAVDEIAPYLRRAAQAAAGRGCVLAVENENTCNAATGVELARLLAAVDRPNCRAIWDPGNAHLAGELAYPDGYQAVRRYVASVHLKDSVRQPLPGEEPWRLLGEGEVDWRRQLAALAADGYAGLLTLEPHPVRPYERAEAARRSLQNLRQMVADLGQPQEQPRGVDH